MSETARNQGLIRVTGKLRGVYLSQEKSLGKRGKWKTLAFAGEQSVVTGETARHRRGHRNTT